MAVIITTPSFVTMEGAFLIMISVMAIMTVEITVMKMDVSGDRWEKLTVFLASLS